MKWRLRMLPWTSKHERQAAIGAAKAEKEQSQATAAHASRVERDIRALYQQNHWAGAVADALGVDRHGRNGGK